MSDKEVLNHPAAAAVVVDVVRAAAILAVPATNKCVGGLGRFLIAQDSDDA